MNAQQMALIAGIAQDMERMSLRLTELVQLFGTEENDWRPLPAVPDLIVSELTESEVPALIVSELTESEPETTGLTESEASDLTASVLTVSDLSDLTVSEPTSDDSPDA
jgi:hypothetical protein